MSNIGALQTYLKTHQLAAFIVPHDDLFMGEYLAAHDERLAWATGFTGSAGLGIITQAKALLQTDSRYTIQAAQQCPHINVLETNAQPFAQLLAWLQQALPQGGQISFDPWLFSQKRFEHWQMQLQNTSFKLTALSANPIDALWHNRPNANPQKFWQHPIEVAGQSTPQKLALLNITTPTMLTDVASVNWLLNIRGADIPYTPYAQSFALVMPQGDITLFIDLAKVPQDLPKNINCVALQNLTNFNYPTMLQADPATAPYALWQHWHNQKIMVQPVPDNCHGLRTLKNPTELAGARQAHTHDAAAMANFLNWFSQQHGRTNLTEVEVVQALQNCRVPQQGYMGDSFATIAGAGPNGAIVHYKPEPTTCRTLQPNELLLIDSGAQYNGLHSTASFCGTTDITRVLWFGQGTPNAQSRHIYTTVLKSHIAAASAVFPQHTTTGAQIDALARAPLWAQGLNFGHGLGHGVGSFASVHDGAVKLSPQSQGVLAATMLLTIEPGVYITGQFGVRLENVYEVVESGVANMLAFKPLTLVPFDMALVDMAALTLAEQAWLVSYHALCGVKVC